MGWPTPQDYNEAIQNPSLCFEDEELRTGSPELTPLGLPRPNSGAFASVYRLYNGKSSHAVRCFLRNITDQEDRYNKLTDYICHDSFEATVPFQFIRHGIRIQSQWYPILKMDWVDGDTLDHFVRDNLHRSNTLRTLAQAFLKMHLELNKERVAHGDLQHGNIMITRGQLRLVDYDGMYIPSLTGKLSNEVGHPNYQHPSRDKNDFGPYLDNFSAWVIYTSLIAISVDKSLCDRLNGLDDCLLFRARDFRDPFNSKAFQLLERHQSSEVSLLTRNIRSHLKRAPKDVPLATDEPTEPKRLEDLPLVINIKRDSDWSFGGGDLLMDEDQRRAAESGAMPWYAEPQTKVALAEKNAVNLIVDPDPPRPASLPARPSKPAATLTGAAARTTSPQPAAPQKIIGGWTEAQIRDYLKQKNAYNSNAAIGVIVIAVLLFMLSMAFMLFAPHIGFSMFCVALVLIAKGLHMSHCLTREQTDLFTDTIINSQPHKARFYFQTSVLDGQQFCHAFVRSCDSIDIYHKSRWREWPLADPAGFCRRHVTAVKHEVDVEAFFSQSEVRPIAIIIDGDLEWFV